MDSVSQSRVQCFAQYILLGLISYLISFPVPAEEMNPNSVLLPAPRVTTAIV